MPRKKQRKIEEWRPHALRELAVQETLWLEFLRHRRTIKKPMTDFGQYLACRRLWRLKKQGEDPTAVIEQSIELGWQGLFPVNRDDKRGRAVERGSAGLAYFEG